MALCSDWSFGYHRSFQDPLSMFTGDIIIQGLYTCSRSCISMWLSTNMARKLDTRLDRPSQIKYGNCENEKGQSSGQCEDQHFLSYVCKCNRAEPISSSPTGNHYMDMDIGLIRSRLAQKQLYVPDNMWSRTSYCDMARCCLDDHNNQPWKGLFMNPKRSFSHFFDNDHIKTFVIVKHLRLFVLFCSF